MVMVVLMMMTMKIDALASNDPSSGDAGSLSASSPSGSLPEVRFRCVLVSLCLAPQNRIHGVNKFDEAMSMTVGTVRRYRRA
jgi:hypothetical protein